MVHGPERDAPRSDHARGGHEHASGEASAELYRSVRVWWLVWVLGLSLLHPDRAASQSLPDLSVAASLSGLRVRVEFGLLALVAIALLRARSRIAMPSVWLFSIVGLVDLLNAFYQASSAHVQPEQFGAVYFTPTFVVPAAIVTHVMILRLLLRRQHPLRGNGSSYADGLIERRAE